MNVNELLTKVNNLESKVNTLQSTNTSLSNTINSMNSKMRGTGLSELDLKFVGYYNQQVSGSDTKNLIVYSGTGIFLLSSNYLSDAYVKFDNSDQHSISGYIASYFAVANNIAKIPFREKLTIEVKGNNYSGQKSFSGLLFII